MANTSKFSISIITLFQGYDVIPLSSLQLVAPINILFPFIVSTIASIANTVGLTTHPLKGIWVIFTVGLLGMKLAWIFAYSVLHDKQFSLLRDKCPCVNSLLFDGECIKRLKETAHLFAWVAVPFYIHTWNEWVNQFLHTLVHICFF